VDRVFAGCVLAGAQPVRGGRIFTVAGALDEFVAAAVHFPPSFTGRTTAAAVVLRFDHKPRLDAVTSEIVNEYVVSSYRGCASQHQQKRYGFPQEPRFFFLHFSILSFYFQ
jgi:hypothetical protein